MAMPSWIASGRCPGLVRFVRVWLAWRAPGAVPGRRASLLGALLVARLPASRRCLDSESFVVVFPGCGVAGPPGRAAP